MDTSGNQESQAIRVNPEENVLDKVEEEEDGGQSTGRSGGMVSQNLFLTREQPSHTHQSSSGKPDAGEGRSGKYSVSSLLQEHISSFTIFFIRLEG